MTGEAVRKRVVRRGETPVLGVGFPTRYEVWRDDDPAKPELTLHSRELRDGRELGPEFKDALLAFGARNGVEPPREMATAEPTGFAIEMRTTSKHNRSNLLPESVVYTKRVLGDKDAVLSETIVRYEFDWDWPATILLDRPLAASPDGSEPSPSQVNHKPEPTSPDGSRVASLKSRPPPRYPPSAIRRRESGTTIVRGRVGADGVGRDLVVVQSSGSAALDEAAVESLRHANFHPALEAHTPIESEVEIPTDFRLNEM